MEIIRNVVTAEPDRHYIHTVLASQLLAEKTSTRLKKYPLDLCREYLEQREENKPQPPSDWGRPLPDSPKNKKFGKCSKNS
jgi:hypothetical protein